MRDWRTFYALGDPNAGRVWEILSRAASECSRTPQSYWAFLYDQARDDPKMLDNPDQDVAIELARSIVEADDR